MNTVHLFVVYILDWNLCQKKKNKKREREICYFPLFFTIIAIFIIIFTPIQITLEESDNEYDEDNDGEDGKLSNIQSQSTQSGVWRWVVGQKATCLLINLVL